MVEVIASRKASPGRIIGVQWHPEFAHNAPVPHHDAEQLYDWVLGQVV
ncbi:MAG: hypothetical protein AAFQ68_27820 [Bacteroidota bacterium]